MRNNLKTLPPGFCIDRMVVSDVHQVQLIEQDCFPVPWSHDAILHEVRNPRALTRVVRNGRTVTGYLIGWQVADEFHLGNIAVHRDFRKRGLASSLLADIGLYLTEQKCALVTLEVRESNQGARHLYARHGYKAVALRRHYYPDTGEDAVIMVKSLTPVPPAL
jgi:ribosomal-protein-alanine N-acetyltransferase